MKQKIKKIRRLKKAFSLIELSIVILIIGIIVAGVTQSSRLISEFKLSNARSLTESAPVASISGLSAWFETTRTESIPELQAQDQAYISTWHDINPATSTKHDVISSAPPTTSPKYIASCINSLPCIRFDGTDDYLSFDANGGDFLIGSDYTIFAVEQRRSAAQGYFFGASQGITVANDRVMLGYSGDTSILFSQDNNDYSATVDAYSTPSAKVHTFRLSSAGGGLRSYYLNGISTSLDSGTGADPTALISSNSYASIGYSISATNSGFFNGDIAEIIIYTRALKAEERNSVEVYLGKKWHVAVTSY